MTNQQVKKEIVNEIKCTCGECEQEGNYYICVGCNRLAPYCFGAGDKYFDYCDDCAVELMEDDEEKTLEKMRTIWVNHGWAAAVLVDEG